MPYFCRIDAGQFGQGTEKSTISFVKKCNKKHLGLVFKIQWQGFVTDCLWFEFSAKIIGSTRLSKIGVKQSVAFEIEGSFASFNSNMEINQVYKQLQWKI